MLKKVRKNFKSSYFYNLFSFFFGKYKKSYSENFGEDLFVDFFSRNSKKVLMLMSVAIYQRHLLLLIFFIKKVGVVLI